MIANLKMLIRYLITAGVPYSGKVWQTDSFQPFGERKFGKLTDQPIGYYKL